ncbi:MAG: trehalose-phosphatase [Acidimicrobiales bacterium]
MTSENLGELSEQLGQLARTPRLLVATDFDGVVAPIVDDPMAARAHPPSASALRSLAALDYTSVAVISGRSLRDLALLSRLPEEIALVGSHGGEFDVGFASHLSPELEARLDVLREQVTAVGVTYGARVEHKPAGVAFHFRNLDPAAAKAARDELVRGPASADGVHTRSGHLVMEMAVVDADKGTALQAIRTRVDATAAVFFGDDVTDEDAFRTLGGADVGVRVGDGPTVAGFRVASPMVVAEILQLLLEFRSEWLQSANVVPIDGHSLLSDQRTTAVISPTARVSWMCTPRIDSASVFAELVGGPPAGRFVVADHGGRPPITQRYRLDTMLLTTEFPTFTVTDYLDASSDRVEDLARRSDLVRRIEGSGRAEIEFAPRLDFGRVATRLETRPDGLVVTGTADRMALRSPGVTWSIVDEGSHQTARATVDIPSHGLVLELRAGTSTCRADPVPEADRGRRTEQFWSSWVAGLALPDRGRELVARSALTLKALCHAPTGAIVTAPTTSLPQHLGGVRNWDYRYCWIRNGAMAATILARIGSVREGTGFLRWLTGVIETRSGAARLAPVYSVTGRHLAPEAEINDLTGYAGSRPVRVGNAADVQPQIDAFGPVVELIRVLQKADAAPSGAYWDLVVALVDAVGQRWRHPDHGIWEIRRPPRQHVYSKVMAWATVDRAIGLAGAWGREVPDGWPELRSAISEEVIAKGWKPRVGAFTAAYDGTDLDASVLAIGLWGLLPPTDERFLSTLATVERELRRGATVHRYLEHDGLAGREGGYHLMTSWLIDAMVLTGRLNDAEDLFAQLCDLVGPTGLLSEEYDAEARRALGNTPHLYSHLGLIGNAVNLDV